MFEEVLKLSIVFDDAYRQLNSFGEKDKWGRYAFSRAHMETSQLSRIANRTDVATTPERAFEEMSEFLSPKYDLRAKKMFKYPCFDLVRLIKESVENNGYYIISITETHAMAMFVVNNICGFYDPNVGIVAGHKPTVMKVLAEYFNHESVLRTYDATGKMSISYRFV